MEPLSIPRTSSIVGLGFGIQALVVEWLHLKVQQRDGNLQTQQSLNPKTRTKINSRNSEPTSQAGPVKVRVQGFRLD